MSAANAKPKRTTRAKPGATAQPKAAATPDAKPKLIVLLGPTASGKTALALRLARRFKGEIVSADSRTIYKGMDIGTSKPPRTAQRAVRHHLLNIASPHTVVTLVDWQQRAYRAIDSIIKKNKQPFLVGGTGLYISSIVDDYRVPRTKGSPRYTTLLLGLAVPRPMLYERINGRVITMIKQGLEKEVLSLTKRYSWKLPALHGIGYREWQSYFSKKRNKRETITAIQQATRNFAKRQMTWFRMMERQGHTIHWISKPSEAVRLIKLFIKT